MFTSNKSHPLLDEALGPRQADPALIGEQLPHRADAAAAEVVDIVENALALLQVEQVLHRREEILGESSTRSSSEIDA